MDELELLQSAKFAVLRGSVGGDLAWEQGVTYAGGLPKIFFFLHKFFPSLSFKIKVRFFHSSFSELFNYFVT